MAPKDPSKLTRQRLKKKSSMTLKPQQTKQSHKRTPRQKKPSRKAGTLPDTGKLSDQIRQQILSSPDLQNKVTEGVKSVDGDTIYSKIVSKVSKQFATRGEFEKH